MFKEYIYGLREVFICSVSLVSFLMHQMVTVYLLHEQSWV